MQGSRCLSAPGCCIARLTQRLVVVWRSFFGGRLVELVVGHPRPSLFGHRCTVGVLAGTHRCATESRVTLWQSANPCCVFVGVVGVVTSCVPCVRVRGRTSRSCATENTYTPAPLEALFKLSVVAILSPSYHLRQIFSAGCGCSLQLVILFDTFFISFEISSKCSCLLSAVSQSILFT